MPRTPKLRKKNGSWYTSAGSPSGTYFGSVVDVPYAEAWKRFTEHLREAATARKATGTLTVAQLAEAFLGWMQSSRSERNYDERRRHLSRFCRFRVGNQKIAELLATAVRPEDLTAFIDSLKKKRLADWTIAKHHTSIAACFAWGAGKRNPSPILPRDFTPFAGMERYKRPPDSLLEDELPTETEIDALLKHADDDLEPVYENQKWRKRRADEQRHGDSNPYRGFKDLLTVYYATGARTSELAAATVGQFVKSAKQLVLTKHKRSKALKESAARRITLSDEAFEIVGRLCKGRKPDEPIFSDPKGRAWTRLTLCTRFQQVRERAGVRDAITIYSFRHLWISEALMHGADLATVSKLAGTSIQMVEKVYGHYRNDHLQNVQNALAAARKLRSDTAGR